MLPARISLTLSRHFSLSFVASGKSSGLHPVCSSWPSCFCPAICGRGGVHRSTSLMSSSLLLQQCPACLLFVFLSFTSLNHIVSLTFKSCNLFFCFFYLSFFSFSVCLTWIVFVMGGRWPYSWCFVGCCLQDLFKNAVSNIEQEQKYSRDTT